MRENTINYTIRKLSDENFSDLVFNQAEAYPGMKIVSAEERAATVGRLKSSLEDKRITWYGAFLEDKLVGSMRMHDFNMNLHGRKVLAGGLGAVAVDLLHKKQHVARELASYYLKQYYQKDSPIAVLWPFHAEFYHKMGFGLGAPMYQYRVKPASFPRGESRDYVRYLTRDDIPGLTECYNRFVERRTGMIDQTETGWRRRFDSHKDYRYVGYQDGPDLKGFMIYRFRPTGSENFLDNELVVLEMVYDTPEALAEMLAFLHTQLDQIGCVVFQTPDAEFYYRLSDPYNDSRHMINPTYLESHTVGLGVMYRIVNNRLFFELLDEHDFGGVTLRLKLTIHDSFLPENDGSLILHVNNGQVVIAEDADYEAEITLDIAEFSSLVMGAVGFRTLVDYRLAAISDDTCLNQVHDLFATPEKPLCLTAF